MNKSKNWKNNRSRKPQGKNNGKGNRTYSKSEAQEVADSHDDCSINDPRWYSASPQLLVDAASIPSAWITGLPLSLNTPEQTEHRYIRDAVQPGVMAFAMHQRPCLTESNDSPFNVMLTQMTSYARSINSGAKNWDAPDLGIYICAVANLYGMVSWAERLYGTARLFATTNRYYPADLFSAQKVNYSNIMSHLADFRTELNVLIAKVSSLPMPITIPMAEKWAWSYRYYYCDSDNAKDQVYFYYPANYYTFAYDSEHAGKLIDHAIADAAAGPEITYQEVCAIINEQVSAILADQDMAIIGGDLISAFGATKWTFNEIPESYVCVPTHTPEVLWQMRNIQTPVHFSVHDIVQSPNKAYLMQATDNLISQVSPMTSMDGHSWNVDLGDYLKGYKDNFYFVSDNDSIAPIEYITNTRQTTLLDDYTLTGDEYNCEWVTGTTVVTGIRCVYRNVNATTGVVTTKVTDFSTRMLIGGYSTTAEYQFMKGYDWFFEMLPILSKFRFCPSIEFAYLLNTGSNYRINFEPLPLGEVKNYSIVNNNLIENMHRICAMSESGMIQLALSRFNGTRQS